VDYSVESFKELDIIINHFNIYPLVTAKINDFFIFKQCFEMIKRGEHLTKEGLFKIVSLKSSLNLGLSEKLIKAFPSFEGVEYSAKLSPYSFKSIPDPFWISGFIAGDGSFNLKIGTSSTTSIGRRIQLRFGIGLHIRELEVIKGIAAYFHLLSPISKLDTLPQNGYIELNADQRYKYIDIRPNAVLFQITKFDDILNIIIPFFDKYPIQGQKAFDFEDFKIVSTIIKNKEHLTNEGFAKILEIKERMNKYQARKD
jgi:hypothetical protein